MGAHHGDETYLNRRASLRRVDCWKYFSKNLDKKSILSQKLIFVSCFFSAFGVFFFEMFFFDTMWSWILVLQQYYIFTDELSPYSFAELICLL